MWWENGLRHIKFECHRKFGGFKFEIDLMPL